MSEVAGNNLQRWAAAYSSAWERGDGDAVTALFTAESTYRSVVFDEPHHGREGIRAYWQRVTGSQSNAAVAMGDPIVDDNLVALEWWGQMSDDDEGGEVTLPGVLLLDMDADGLCRRLHEYWSVGPAHTEPFPGWGRMRTGETEATRTAARRWAAAWETSWERHETGPALACYSDEIAFRSGVFRKVARGREGVRDYMVWAFASERDPHPSFGEPRVAGANAAVEYWTIAREAAASENRDVTIAGCSILTFDPNGLVVEQHDYWNSRDGAHSPPPEWGPAFKRD